MNQELVVCKRCVMDTSDSKIIFDSNGVCDHCNTFDKEIKPKWDFSETGLNQFHKKVLEIKKASKNNEHDCIIGMSGGIDSSYLVYAAKEIFNLNPLVFHVDAGWNSQIAVNNIQRLVDVLDLDLYTEVINWEEMKDLQKSFFKSGVPHIDTPQDHAFFATMYKFALKHNIKYILTGANYSTECIRNPIEWMYYQSDSIQIRDIHNRFGSKKLSSFPLTSILKHKIWLPYFKGIKVERPLNFIPYKKSEAKKLLIDKFGWQPYPQKHFESRFTKFYESFWLPKRFGYDVRKVQFSSLIMTGQMSRDDALEELKKPTYDVKEIEREIEFICNKLEISREDFDSYINLPKKTYQDYKNQREIYYIGAKLLKLMGIELGGKR